MRWLAPLFFISSIVMNFSALAQPVQVGPSGDFRINDQPGTAPTVGPPGGPSLPLSPTILGDPTGTKSSDEILRSIDKDLGGRKSSSFEPQAGGRSLDLDKDLLTGSDKGLK